MNRLTGSLLVAMTVFPGLGAAQSIPAQGERVRIGQSDGTVVVGSFEGGSTEAVRLRASPTGEERLIPLDAIARMDRSLGRERRFGKYFAVGVASTSAAVGVVSGMSWSPCTSTGPFSCMLHPNSRGDALVLGLVGGAVIGIPVGIITGLAVREERWSPLPLPGSGGATWSIRPVLGSQVGVSASLAF